MLELKMLVLMKW